MFIHPFNCSIKLRLAILSESIENVYFLLIIEFTNLFYLLLLIATILI